MTDLKIVEGGWYQAECGAVFGPMKFERREPNQYWTANGITFELNHFSPVLLRRVNPPSEWVEPVVAENATAPTDTKKHYAAGFDELKREWFPQHISRRDLFAAAALAGMMANSKTSYSDVLTWNVDEYLARLDKEGGK